MADKSARMNDYSPKNDKEKHRQLLSPRPAVQSKHTRRKSLDLKKQFGQIKIGPMGYSDVHSLGNTSIASESSRITGCINRFERRQVKRIDIASESSRISINSIETILEEDAPGLVKFLKQKGIDMNEIKLYGASEIGDDRFFSELKFVIPKILTKKSSLLKSTLPRSSSRNSDKKGYCVSYLAALVEKSRDLVLKKLPVEWGWCRDLKAFIFVFRKHKRIVLERPGYGNATYSFRLSKYLPMKWQIKRLVIMLKLTNSSRTAIVEDIPLQVGDDLNEEEANVLRGYGWSDNTGFGTMLGHYNRVVHRCNRDERPLYWNAKIVKLLHDGLNENVPMSENDIPKKAAEYAQVFGPDVEI